MVGWFGLWKVEAEDTSPMGSVGQFRQSSQLCVGIHEAKFVELCLGRRRNSPFPTPPPKTWLSPAAPLAFLKIAFLPPYDHHALAPVFLTPFRG